jgi:DNA-binding response OmpR family regulator
VLVIADAALAKTCFSAGVTDLLSRGVSDTELRARVARCLERPPKSRRSGVYWRQIRELRFAGVRVDLATRCIFGDKGDVQLRRAELELLLYLAQNRDRTISAVEITREVLRSGGDGAAARNQMYELRKKLAAATSDEIISTQRGGGYRFVASGTCTTETGDAKKLTQDGMQS